MKITIISIGKLKEAYWRQAAAEYIKRLGRYTTLEMIELADEKAPETLSKAQEAVVLHKEGERILRHVKDGAYVIALAITGRAQSSEEFAQHMETLCVNGCSHIQFIIGGSIGLSLEVLQRADYALSFSKMTFAHQLMRVILLEQIYRSFRIRLHEPYHK